MEEFGSICREVLLWPEGVPSSNGLSGAEQTLGPGLIGNVSVPVLYVYPASQPCGQAVILCPGGGFRGVAVEHEGRAFASWFNERGITLAVLKYRLPNGRREIPGEDIRRAVRLLEERSGELRIRSLGVMGAPSEAMSRRRRPCSRRRECDRIFKSCFIRLSVCGTG